MNKKRNLSDYIFLFIKGVAMGTANKIPGVSGGTVAFIAGFYEEFIFSMKRLNLTAILLLIRGRYKYFAKYVNIKFLLIMSSGMIFSFFSISKILDYFMLKYETIIWSLFFGLIIGSVYHINKNFKTWNIYTISTLTIGITIGLIISFLDSTTENRNLIFIFICGIISVCGMPIPGFSGSFILMLLGNYVLIMIDAVNAFYDTMISVFSGNFDVFQNEEQMNLVWILLVFLLGSIVGLVTLSNILSYILKKFYQPTIAIIIGFIIGSLGAVWPWKNKIYLTDTYGNYILDKGAQKITISYEKYIPKDLNYTILLDVISIVLGIGIILILDKFENKKTLYKREF